MVGGVRMELRIEVLGPVRAWRGPVELPLGPARQRAVFTVLALRAGRAVTRADLVSAVWGVHAPKSVAGNIHTYVSNLRRVLEPDRDRWHTGTLLTSDTSGYRLDVQPERVDAVEFGRLVQDGDVDALDAALALWRGDPLSGLPGPFADAARNRFTELRLVALERRAEALLEAGEYRELAPELAALVAEYPLRERLRELLMLALHHSGQRADALEVFTETRRVLAAELAVEPRESLRDLHARMLGEDLDERPDRLVVRPAPVSGPFVGRQLAVRRLRTLVDAVREGRGGAVWVEGDFGIGKSTLLTHALALAPSRGCQLGWVVTDEQSPGVPLGVVRECLGLDQATTMDVVLARVTELCMRGPLVLVVDGMQWADEASVLAWHRLMSAARRLPLLLVTAARPVPRGPALVRLRHELHSRDHILHVGPLTDEETLELQERLTGTRHRELVAGAGGNPRYITELLSAPRSLMETMRRHLDVLSDEARSTLRQAALLGTEFTVAEHRRGHRQAAVGPAVGVRGGGDRERGRRLRRPARVPPAAAARGLLRRDPAGDRDGLHRQAAEALAAGGAPVTPGRRAARRETAVIDTWVLELARRPPRRGTGRAGCRRSPADLLRPGRWPRASRPTQRREVLLVGTGHGAVPARALPDGEAARRWRLATDPARRAEMRHLLATMRFRRGDVGAAIADARGRGRRPGVPEIWRRPAPGAAGQLSAAADLTTSTPTERPATSALDEAVAAGAAYRTAFALQTHVADQPRSAATTRRRWPTSTRARRRPAGHDVLAGLPLDLLDNRLFTLQNLDRLDEAERTLADGGAFAAAHRFRPASRCHRRAALLAGPLGRGARRAELGDRGRPGDHVPRPARAGRGDDAAARRGGADRGPPATAPRPPPTSTRPTRAATDAERESFDFLLVAQARSRPSSRAGRARGLDVLAPLLDPSTPR